MKFFIDVHLTLMNKQGKIVRKKVIHAKSIVGNFLATLCARLVSTNLTSPAGMANILGNPIATWNQAPSLAMITPASSDHGIQVGTSNVPNVITQFALGARIADGNGAGQLAYTAAHNFNAANALQIVGNDITFSISRLFTNNSGATITIRETGIHVHSDTPLGEDHVLMERQVCPDFPLLNTQFVQVLYVFRIHV